LHYDQYRIYTCAGKEIIEVLSVPFWLAFALVFFATKLCMDAGLSALSGFRVRRVAVPSVHGPAALPVSESPGSLKRAA
jgi:hypothetical protein